MSSRRQPDCLMVAFSEDLPGQPTLLQSGLCIVAAAEVCEPSSGSNNVKGCKLEVNQTLPPGA